MTTTHYTPSTRSYTLSELRDGTGWPADARFVLVPATPAPAGGWVDYLRGKPLTEALWWFIENMSEDDPARTEAFFALRERVRAEPATAPSPAPDSDEYTADQVYALPKADALAIALTRVLYWYERVDLGDESRLMPTDVFDTANTALRKYHDQPLYDAPVPAGTGR